MFPESEQGASTNRHCSPASLEITVALEWNPKFILKTEPGYEQCGATADAPFKFVHVYLQTEAFSLKAKHFPKKQTIYHEVLLLLHGLEAAMTKFGGSVDELQVNLLQSTATGLHQQGLKDRFKALVIQV